MYNFYVLYTVRGKEIHILPLIAVVIDKLCIDSRNIIVFTQYETEVLNVQCFRAHLLRTVYTTLYTRVE